MATTLEYQTATLLPTGNILIAGGDQTGIFDTGAVSGAELYSPSAQTFTQTGSMIDARVGHTATLLTSGPDIGQVLIVGGENYADTELAKAEVYNPQTGIFSAAPGTPNYPRSMHTATLLQDGTILIAGGYTGCVGCGSSNLAPAEIYDPIQGVFTKVGSLITPRVQHTATLLQNGYVLIVGGRDNNNYATATAELYDPVGKDFVPTGSLNTARSAHSATLLPNGSVLIAGGMDSNGTPLNSAELYNPATGTFTVTGSLNTGRFGHGSALVYSGNVMIYGGIANRGSPANATVVTEQYNPSTGTFTATTNLNIARAFAATVALPGGTVLAAGGIHSSDTYSIDVLSSAEVYSLNNSYITGFVNPKYIVMGLTYAPPGSSSFVSYQNTTTLGTTTMISNSTDEQQGISTSASETFAIPGLQFIGIGNDITVTGTDSSQWTKSSSTSTTVTLSKSMSSSNKTTGTGDPFNPVNSDYDIVWLWLNPLEVFTINASNPDDILWNGYGFDPSDAPKMDIYGVYVGYLDGDWPMDPSVQAELSRSWATNQTWPAGEGPGLTAEDFQNIVAVDPFAGCTYNTDANQWSTCPYAVTNFNVPGAPPTNSADGRFSAYTGNQSIEYAQAGPGNGGGITQTYSNSVTNTQAVANGNSYKKTQSFGIETNFSISANIPLNIFSNDISVKTNYTNSFTTTQSYQQTITTTNMQQDTLSITGPNCPAENPPCSPTYSGPPEFVVYQDNLFGSYMFYPLH
jgi:hypothetical protein